MKIKNKPIINKAIKTLLSFVFLFNVAAGLYMPIIAIYITMKKILLIIVLLILTGCAVKKQKKLIYEQNTQIFLLDKQVQLLKRDIEDKKSIISAYRDRLSTMQQEMNQLRDSRDSLLSKQRL